NAEQKNAKREDKKRQQRNDRNKATSFAHGENRRETGNDNPSHYRRDPRRLKFWMNPAYKRRQQTVVSHCPEDSRLAQKHHQDNRAETGDRAQFDYGSHPADASVIGRHSDRIGYV